VNHSIKIAVIGVGNCASALVQGLQYYRKYPDAPGLITPVIGGHLAGDIQPVAAFDVDSEKVGQDLADAIFLGRNNVEKLCEVPSTGVLVSPAPVLDGLGEKYREHVGETTESNRENVMAALGASGAEVLVNYLPVGSKEATRWWADIALESGCAFVNCIPEFIASDSSIALRFEQAGIPLIGDDVKSQFGATLLHRIIVQHMELKGLTIEKTYQLNFGGNMDFYNMLNANRLASKRQSKREAVRSLQKAPLAPRYVHIGPSDYVAWLEDNKWCYIHIQGTGFAGTPMRLEAKLEVCDSPNSAGVVVDLVRLARLALGQGVGGPVADVCAFYMKSPPLAMPDDLALEKRDEWLEKMTERA